jgi:hypothetical protein
MTFREYAEISGEPLRQISFTPPTNCEHLIRELKGFESFSSAVECLDLLRPVYGLKDAPKAWRIKLDHALKSIGILQCRTDPGIYVMHDASKKLVLMITCHVDDLKCTGTTAARQHLSNGLTKLFGKLTEKQCVGDETLEHCGIIHSRKGHSVIMSQSHYVKQLKLLDVTGMDPDKPEVPLTPVQLGQFQSLLGAVSWLCQTRIDIPI